MPKPILILLVLLVLLAGLVFLFASQADEVPTEQIEIEVNAPADAG